MRKPKSDLYFTQEHEDAIVAYCVSEDLEERNKIYADILEPVFNELISKIVYTYKFNELPNIESLIDECKVWIVTTLHMYDPARGHKAFSYFSVSTKNWFIQKHKKRKTELKRQMCYESLSNADREELIVHNEYETQRESKEFMAGLIGEIDKWDKDRFRLLLGANDLKVLAAIRILFESIDDLQILNKKAIFLYLREITGLSTKQISRSLKKFRKKYTTFKSTWDSGDYDNE